MSIYDGNWITSAVGKTINTAGTYEIESLLEALKKLPPPLPPPDPHKCVNCKEEMSTPAMPVYSTGFPYGRPDAYLCGRCAVMVKREYFYKPRQRKLDSLPASAKTAGGRG